MQAKVRDTEFQFPSKKIIINKIKQNKKVLNAKYSGNP